MTAPILRPKSTFAQRPLQARDFRSQWRETGLEQASPIEQKFGAALLDLILNPREFGPPDFINLFFRRREFTFEEMPPIAESIDEGVINILPEAQVGAYRCDFALTVKAVGSRQIIKADIECDGRPFHDVTWEQRDYDRERDRFMHGRDIGVLRFSGTDIYADAKGCARSALHGLLRQSALRGAA